MRKYLILTFLFLFPFTSIAQENNYFLMLKNKKVNVRYGPSLDHPVKYIYRKIDFKTSLACRLPVVTAVDPNIPSVSQSKTPSAGSPW